MQTKMQRHRAIIAIIESIVVATQEHLARELRKRGVRVTQATLSRDLAELGLVRIHTPEGLRYAVQRAAAPQPRIAPALVGSEVIAIVANESLIVLRTEPGCAQSVAAFLDAARLADILGTIAGDDTIIVAPRAAARIRPLMKLLRERLGITE